MAIFSAALATSTVIDAPAPDVWHLLTDLDRYAEWNPYYQQASGVVSRDAQLHLRAVLENGGSTDSTVRVVHVDRDRELRWTSSFGLPGLMRTEHRFRLVPDGPGRTRFEQDETFAGLLVPLSGGVVDQVRAGCEAMAQAMVDRLRP